MSELEFQPMGRAKARRDGRRVRWEGLAEWRASDGRSGVVLIVDETAEATGEKLGRWVEYVSGEHINTADRLEVEVV